MNKVEALKQTTTIVVDTADFQELAQFKPQDATTNPSLILKAVQKPGYAPLLEQAVTKYRGQGLDEVTDRLLVRFGVEILSHIPGRVSTEVDARLSFDARASYERAIRLVKLYQAEGVATERVLIKLAATWEGIRAAEWLEREGIKTNLTLVFSLCQAVVCAQAKVQLVSPFVGRIYDWHKKHEGISWDESSRSGTKDPGVQSVRQIYTYYKHFGIATEVMGASFRNTGQLIALAGCDLLTVSPELLAHLATKEGEVPRVLRPLDPAEPAPEKLSYDEPEFRLELNNDAMAYEKLGEGIRAFAADSVKLEGLMSAIA